MVVKNIDKLVIGGEITDILSIGIENRTVHARISSSDFALCGLFIGIYDGEIVDKHVTCGKCKSRLGD